MHCRKVPRTSCLPCARGGGFASAKPEGLFRAAKRGRASIFTPAVNPSVALCATAPLTQGSQGVDSPAEKFTISRACGSRCTGEPGANSAPAAARADSGFLSYFLFQKKHRRHNSTKLYRLQSETTKVSFATFLFQRKRLRHSVCRQPLSRALRDSSPYTGEP